MGVYIGFIEIKGSESLFYDFKPIAEVKDSKVIQLSSNDKES